MGGSSSGVSSDGILSGDINNTAVTILFDKLLENKVKMRSQTKVTTYFPRIKGNFISFGARFNDFLIPIFPSCSTKNTFLWSLVKHFSVLWY